MVTRDGHERRGNEGIKALPTASNTMGPLEAARGWDAVDQSERAGDWTHLEVSELRVHDYREILLVRNNGLGHCNVGRCLVVGSRHVEVRAAAVGHPLLARHEGANATVLACG